MADPDHPDERESGHGHERDADQIHFTIDDEPYTTEAKSLTPAQLLAEFAGVDATTNYLTQVEGDGEQHSYQSGPQVAITMREGMVFVSAGSGPTGVS
jgi:hypothetical protein